MKIEPYVAQPRSIAIVEPRPDESTPVEGASARRVVLDDGGYLDENPGSRITLVLDGSDVRDVTDVRAPLSLGGFGFDGRELAAGEHVLVAVAVGPRGEAARYGSDRTPITAVRRFFVGPPASPAAGDSGPMLVCLVPRGTYNGVARSRSALLDFAVLGGQVGSNGLTLLVRIVGPRDSAEAVLSAPGPYTLRGLGNGDYRFELELANERGPLPGPWARATRTITVNLDGPAK